MDNRFDTIPTCDRQTDGRTDRQTSCYGIVRAVHMRRVVNVTNFELLNFGFFTYIQTFYIMCAPHSLLWMDGTYSDGWSLVGHVRLVWLAQGHCGACRRKWRLTDTDLCPCGKTPTMFHIVESCPLTKLNGGLSRLHCADEDAVSWLTRYGS